MCIPCAEFNYFKRTYRSDLTGKIALVTGGRIKIGYQIALILLRSNALTIVTTRFPKDAALKFSKEQDFVAWKDNLHIYGLDFKYVPSTYEFCEFVTKKYPRLDIIVNNAAQTIRREPTFNEHLVNKEFDVGLEGLPEEVEKLLPTDFKNLQLNSFLEGQKQLKCA